MDEVIALPVYRMKVATSNIRERQRIRRKGYDGGIRRKGYVGRDTSEGIQRKGYIGRDTAEGIRRKGYGGRDTAVQTYGGTDSGGRDTPEWLPCAARRIPSAAGRPP